MIRLDAFTRHSDLGLGILDDMSLVEDAVIVIVFANDIGVVTADVVRCDDDILRMDLRAEALTFGGVPNVHQRLEKWGVVCDFLLPMACNCRGTDYERWNWAIFGVVCNFVSFGSKVVVACDNANSLQSLAKTHV